MPYANFKGKSRGLYGNICTAGKKTAARAKKTQKEMAEFLGVGLRAYQYYEGAKHYPEVPGLLKLADLFGVSTDYLLGRSAER